MRKRMPRKVHPLFSFIIHQKHNIRYAQKYIYGVSKIIQKKIHKFYVENSYFCNHQTSHYGNKELK